MLGTIIEKSGDALDESHMPLGWPLTVDGAVRQFCGHKRATVLFFRPSPLRLSPGRHTVFVLMNELANA